MTETVYVPLIHEGVDVWRPVEAIRLADGLYRLTSEPEADEVWQFPSGSIVRCRSRLMGDGTEALVAVSAES